MQIDGIKMFEQDLRIRLSESGFTGLKDVQDKTKIIILN